MILLKFLESRNGHEPGTFQKFEEPEAVYLIADGIAEAAYKEEVPEIPSGMTLFARSRRG